MKKCSFIGLFAGLIVSTGFLFTACDSFLNGSLLKQQIEENIEYENAPSYTIRVEAEENTGTITLGSAGYTKKVTDYFEVGFKKNSGYKFIEWRAVSNTDGSSLDEYIEFTNKNSLETKCRLLKDSNDIKILPFCESQISFVEALPEYDENGKPRDSAIKIIFSNELLEDNDFSKIKISIDGSNVDANVYFNEPQYIRKDKTLQILAKTTNRIVVPYKETKSVLVTIPADFKYKGAKSGEILEIGEELQHSYRINSTTCDNAYVNYGVCVPAEDTYDIGGTIKISGIPDSSIEQVYSIGDTATVTFKPADGFVFDCWTNSNEKAVTLTTPDPVENPLFDERGFCASTGTATATITAISGGKNIKVTAEVIRLPVENINIDSQFGKLSPIGTKEYKQTDKIALTFNADSDYQFIGWKAFSDSTKQTEVPAEYISFENAEEQNTTFTLNKTLENAPLIYIEPVCVRRPKVVSATPGYDTAGVYRDRTIVIMFDQEMDESSIYWTEEEIKTILGTSLSNYTLLPEGGKTINEKKYYHGYVNKNNEDDVVFKNIKISELSNQSNNLLKYYDTPEFDAGNNRTLRIKTKTKTEGLVQVADAPDAALEVLVTVSKSFNQLVGESNINLSNDYSWVYFTNENTDIVGPVFTTDKVHITVADVNQTAYVVKSDLKSVFYTKKTSIPEYNVKEGKLWVNAEISDAGIGAARISVVINQIKDGNNSYLCYPVPNNPSYKSVILNTKISGQTCSASQMIDISDLQEGFYEAYFVGYDKNGRSTDSNKFYFVYDIVGPKITSTFTLNDTIAIDKLKITKNENTDIQYEKSKIADVDFTDNTTVKTIANLGETSRTHNVKITDYDYAGNETVSYQEVTAVPALGMVYYLDGYWSREYVSTKTPAGIIFAPEIDNQYGNCTIVDLYIDKTTRKLVNYYNGWGSAPYGWGDVYDNDGRRMYEAAKSYWENNNINVSNVSQLYDYLINTKNKEQKWVDNGIVWYLPGINESLNSSGFYGFYIYPYRTALNNGYETIKDFYTGKGETVTNIDEMGQMVTSTMADGNQLLVVYRDGGYYKFNSSTGHSTWSLYMAHVTLR